MSLPIEQWKPVPGYEGLYDVSDQGCVRSWKRPERAPHTMKPGSTAFGYPLVTLSGQDRRPRTLYVHHLVAAVFVGPRPPGLQIRHLDGNPKNNRADNLRYGTASENNLDKRIHGTDPNRNKTHCPQGHEYNEQNSRIDEYKRVCRVCHTERGRRRVNCKTCGREVRYSNMTEHNRVHHSGRTPGRVYVRQPIAHGTAGGYAMHCNRKEPVPAGDPCGCRAAHAAAARAKKLAKLATASAATSGERLSA